MGLWKNFKPSWQQAKSRFIIIMQSSSLNLMQMLLPIVMIMMATDIVTSIHINKMKGIAILGRVTRMRLIDILRIRMVQEQ